MKLYSDEGWEELFPPQNHSRPMKLLCHQRLLDSCLQNHLTQSTCWIKFEAWRPWEKTAKKLLAMSTNDNQWVYCAYCKGRFARISEGERVTPSNERMLIQYGHKDGKPYVATDNKYKLHRSCRRTLQNKELSNEEDLVRIAHTCQVKQPIGRKRKCTFQLDSWLLVFLWIGIILFVSQSTWVRVRTDWRNIVFMGKSQAP